MAIPDEILRLVETFNRNIDAYKSGSYNETQVRREFIDPFFESLGWDINNRQGHAEAYKDVIHEDAIKIGDSTKAPDYCFRIGGTRKFFVEAKKPSVNIKDDIAPAFQLRRYAWSSKLPLSIVTDFEEFAVYDCRIKPVKTDKASVARVKYFNFSEYPDRWDEIVSIFSHDAILKGSFDKYAQSRTKRERITSIDITQLPVKHVRQAAWKDIEDVKFILDASMLPIISSIRQRHQSLFADAIEIRRGVLFDKSILTSEKSSSDSYRYFEGNIYRYQTDVINEQWVEFGPKMKEYPRDFKWFEGERLLLRRLVNRRKRLMASKIDATTVTNKNLYVIFVTAKESINYSLGLLNSKLIARIYLSQISQATKDDFPQVTIKDAKNLPFRTIDFSDSTDKSLHDKMVSLVQTMLDLNKSLQNAKTPDEKNVLQRQITATDNQIDQLVYELYNLTKEEIKIIEETNS